jgi:hypothetical protein
LISAHGGDGNEPIGPEKASSVCASLSVCRVVFLQHRPSLCQEAQTQSVEPTIARLRPPHTLPRPCLRDLCSYLKPKHTRTHVPPFQLLYLAIQRLLLPPLFTSLHTPTCSIWLGGLNHRRAHWKPGSQQHPTPDAFAEHISRSHPAKIRSHTCAYFFVLSSGKQHVPSSAGVFGLRTEAAPSKCTPRPWSMCFLCG